MFGIGANELILILLFGFLIFGPDKLPDMAKTIGRAIAKFRNAQNEMNNVIKNEVYDPDAEDPFKNPLDALNKLEKDAKKEDRGESFTERKARYDKQRAARKKAEARKAEAEAKKAEAQAKKESEGAADAGKQALTAAAVAGTKAAGAPQKEPATSPTGDDVAPEKKRPTADELYGTKSATSRPVRKSGAAAKAAAAKAASAPAPAAKAAPAKAADDKPAEKSGGSAGAKPATSEGKGE